MSPLSHLRPSRSRLFWEKWSHTFAYLLFALVFIVSVWLVRNDLEASQRASDRQTAVLIAAQAKVDDAKAEASCERGNAVRQAVNTNSENVRFILEYFYEGDPIPPEIEDRLVEVELVNCAEAANGG
jgi:hypothetical protein